MGRTYLLPTTVALRKRLLELLSDGKTHPFFEIVDAVGYTIPPEIAYREVKYTYPPQKPLAELVVMGRRRLVRYQLKLLKVGKEGVANDAVYWLEKS